MAGQSAAARGTGSWPVGHELGSWGVPGGPQAWTLRGGAGADAAGPRGPPGEGDTPAPSVAVAIGLATTGAAPVPFSHEAAVSALAEARALVEAGRHGEALAALSAPGLLTAAPHDTACLLGACHTGLGDVTRAVAAYASALAEQPDSAEALLGTARALRGAGGTHRALVLLEDAVDRAEAGAWVSEGGSWEVGSGGGVGGVTGVPPSQGVAGADAAGLGAQSLVPETPELAVVADRAARLPPTLRVEMAACLTDLGTARKARGAVGWEWCYEAALWALPSYAPAAYNLGVVAGERGDAVRAVTCYRAALKFAPGHIESACNLGVMLRGLGREHEAVEAFRVALAAAPGHPALRASAAAALTSVGAARAQAGDKLGALEDYHAALALAPHHGEALYNSGVAYAELGQLDKAVFMYELAVEALPNCAEAWNNLGVVLRERGDVERAGRCYEAALRARPDFVQGLNNAAVLATQRGEAAAALEALRTALTVQPTYADAWNNLGVLQRDVGVPGEAVASYERCLELDRANRNAGQNRLLALNYVAGGEEEAVCDAHATWGREFEAQIEPLPTSGSDLVDLDRDRSLVVGYVSPDLHTHSVSYFAEAPLTHHNPARVRAVVYDVCARGDARTTRLRAAVEAAGGTWRHVSALSERELAEMVRRDRVDILVDLTGHTAGNRLGTLATRPAPVQATWIGYPNSTGLSSVDWRITDEATDPTVTRQTYVERLWRLPGCFLCYTPSPVAPPVAPAPALRRGHVTFGSFNALAKQTPEVMRVWAAVLAAVPTARLVLKNKPFACAITRDRHWRMWEALGVRRARVDLLPLAPRHEDHLSQYSIMDVALDPWPYAGTTTTTECLLMGVPCVTMRGRCHAHNVGASLLQAAGLPLEWVAGDVTEYVAAAVALAELPPSELDSLRHRLRGEFLSSSLCDGKAFVHGLEEAYRGMWHDWLARQEGGKGNPLAEDVGARADS